MSKKKKKQIPPNVQTRSAPVPPAKKSRSNRNVFILSGLILLLIAFAIFFHFWRDSGAANLRSGMYQGFNILLVTIDTLRADHLPAYGYSGVKTPNLDQLAAKGFLFTNAISHVPLTLPAHTSIMTGLLPITHGVRDNGGYFLEPSKITLAKVLRDKGYTTAAFVSAFVLDSRWQLDQGFQTYSDHFGISEYQEVNPRDIYRSGGETESEFERWLSNHSSKPFFCWIHLYDPHDPYDPPGIYKTEYATHPYDGEIAYTDEVFGKMMAKLQQTGAADRTMIIVTGDHGEALGEHQERTHAMFLYNATQHVPLIIYLPNSKPHKVQNAVGHIDIAPTILDLIGIQVPKSMEGISLIPMMNQDAHTERYIYSESLYAQLHYGWSALQSITTRQYKYIDAPRPELYDTTTDPGETKNEYAEKQQIARVLKTQLSEIVKSNSANESKPAQKMDTEVEEKLRALGYIAGTAASTPESRRIDPKDKIHLIKNVEEALGATLVKDYPGAIRLIEPVLQEDPNLVEAQFVAGVAYAGVSQFKTAIDHLLKTVEAQPDHIRAMSNLGFAYQMMGDLKSGEFWYKQVLKQDPKNPFAITKLAQLYRQMNLPDQAKIYYQQAIQIYDSLLQKTDVPEGEAAIYSSLGEIHFNAGETARAEEAIRKAIQLSPASPQLHYNLAQILEAKKDLPGATESYKEEIRISPTNFMAFNNLGILYLEQNLLEDAAGCFRKVIELQPADARAYQLLALTYKKLGKDEEAKELLKRVPQGAGS